MNDHLVPLTRRAGINLVVEGGLGEERQRVRLLLGHRGRFRRNVVGDGGRTRAAYSLIQRLARGGQRLPEHGARLGCEPPSDDDHAVFVVIHVQGAALVALRRLAGFGQRVDPTPARTMRST